MRDALAASRNIPALKAFQAVNKENPDYISVIERLCFILEQFERKCKEICTDNLDGIDDEQIISALYHIMRIYDHEI